MREAISISATYKDGKKVNYDWYDDMSASKEDCFETEEELTWYVLESIADDDRFTDAVLIEANEVLLDGAKEIHRISTTIDRRSI